MNKVAQSGTKSIQHTSITDLTHPSPANGESLNFTWATDSAPLMLITDPNPDLARLTLTDPSPRLEVPHFGR